MTNTMVTHLFAGNSITFILEFFFGGKSVSSSTHPFRGRKRSWAHLTFRQHENWLICGMSQVEGTRIFKWHAGDGTQIDAVAVSGAVKLKQEIKADFTSAFLFSDSIWAEDQKTFFPGENDSALTWYFVLEAFTRPFLTMECQFSMSEPLWKQETHSSRLKPRRPGHFGHSCHSSSLLTGMRRCCHGPSLQLESGPLWMEGCWSAGTDVVCAWTSAAAVQQSNNLKKSQGNKIISNYTV